MGYKRKKFSFWLNVWREDEQFLADELEKLKQSRLFAPAIRTGIKLIFELRDGIVDTLLQEFPHVVDILMTQEVNDAIADAMIEVDKERQALVAKQAELQKQIEQLAQVQYQVNAQHSISSATPPLTNSQSNNMNNLDIPQGDEDIQLDIKELEGDEEQNSQTAHNFLNSIMNLGA